MDILSQTNVLIDPSLVLAENSINNTFHLIRSSAEYGGKLKFYFPRSLKRLVSETQPSKEAPGIKFFLHGAYPSDLKELNTLIKESSDIVLEFNPTQEQLDKHSYAYETLAEELKYRDELFEGELLNILIEEWIFLQEYSWVVSRIKKPFNRLIAAGAVCIQIGRRTADILVNRTLRREHDEFLNNIDRLRAFGKWIAVGGATAASRLIIPDMTGITVPTMIGIMLLIDPEKLTYS